MSEDYIICFHHQPTTNSHTHILCCNITNTSSVTMQLAVAANAVVSPSPFRPHPLLRSSFSGVSVKLTPQSITFSRLKPLTVFAATKKAVAVLKGTSAVEGVATLIQEDDGSSSPFLSNNSFNYKMVPNAQ